MKKRIFILLSAILGIILILFTVHVSYWNITTVSEAQANKFVQEHNASQTKNYTSIWEGQRRFFSSNDILHDQYAFWVPVIEGPNPPELYIYRFIKEPGWPFDGRYRFVSKIVGKVDEDGAAIVGSYSYTPRDIQTSEKSKLKCIAFFGSQVYWKTTYGEFTVRINDKLHTYEDPMWLSKGLPTDEAFVHFVPLLGVDDNGTTRELVEAKFYNEERELLYTYHP